MLEYLKETDPDRWNVDEGDDDDTDPNNCDDYLEYVHGQRLVSPCPACQLMTTMVPCPMGVTAMRKEMK
jgi:hypothetical protein